MVDDKPKFKFEVGDKVFISLNGTIITHDFIDDIIPNNGKWFYVIDDCLFPESHLTPPLPLIES